MNEQIYALSMVFLEMLFVFVALVALYNQRRVIGQSGFVMAFAMILFFSHLVNAADIRTQLWGNLSFQVGEVAMFLPTLAAFLMVYIISGALAAQRLLIGGVILFLLFVYFTHIIGLQCEWDGFAISGGIKSVALDQLLDSGRSNVNGKAALHLLLYMTTPVVYSICFKWHASRKIAIPAALAGSQLCYSFLSAAAFALCGNGFHFLDGNFYAMLCSSLLLSLMLAFYLARLEDAPPEEHAGHWDFFFAFFGSYGRMRELQSDLSEWQSRHQQLLRSIAEAVFLCDQNGIVISCNISAGKLFHNGSPEYLCGKNIFSLLTPDEAEKIDLSTELNAPGFFHAKVRDPKARDERTIYASISPVNFRNRRFLLVIGRDITGELKLAAEKNALLEQLNHSQRLESLGFLAGGVAHDFNNYIHAILGHVDAATIIDADNPEAISSHLNKIGSIAENAGKLTAQLLGFARKGKYCVTVVSLPELLQNCRQLLGPQKLSNIDFELKLPKGSWQIAADRMQIQQVLLNLLLNSIYAMQESAVKKLTLSLSDAGSAAIKFNPPPEFEHSDPQKYIAITICDSGCGMTPEVAKKVFEPFFTTKPVGVGTGMGLAMAYGILANHKGWLQFTSTPGAGTTFCIFIPAYEK